MNLIFGAGEETEEFWNSVLLPLASNYYTFSLNELFAYKPNLNALYFAFVH
jgi:hypothetical protein